MPLARKSASASTVRCSRYLSSSITAVWDDGFSVLESVVCRVILASTVRTFGVFYRHTGWRLLRSEKCRLLSGPWRQRLITFGRIFSSPPYEMKTRRLGMCLRSPFDISQIALLLTPPSGPTPKISCDGRDVNQLGDQDHLRDAVTSN